jgi:putative hydrolase of the HAD superfamily
MKYKAVIFDLFGTLVDTSSKAAYAKALSEMAIILKVPPQTFVQMWFDTFPHRATGKLKSPEGNIAYICNELKITCNEAQIKEASRIRLYFTGESLKPRTDAVAVLSEIKQRGLKIGLISDCSWEIPTLWQSIALAPLIDVPLFSCSVGMKKPDPRIYKKATDELGVAAAHCMYVGDGSSNELTGAQKAGMSPVLIRVPYERTADAYRIDEEEWAGPTVSSLTEVLGLLD